MKRKNIVIRKSCGLIVVVNLFSLLYVYQQVTIYKVGYKLKNNEKMYEMLSDETRVLEYRVSSLKSPGALEESMLAKNIDLAYVDNVEIVKVKSRQNPGTLQERKMNPILQACMKWFSLNRTAIAESFEVEE